MSKLTAEGGLSLQQEENRANYCNLVKGLAEQHHKSFDVNSIEDKLKKFKFAGKAQEGDKGKDMNWFSKVGNDKKSVAERIEEAKNR